MFSNKTTRGGIINGSLSHGHFTNLACYRLYWKSQTIALDLLTWFYLPLFQGRSHTSAAGRAASGDLRAPTSWHATTANTPARSHSNADTATDVSPAAIIWLSTWRDTCNQSSPRGTVLVARYIPRLRSTGLLPREKKDDKKEKNTWILWHIRGD